MRTGRFFVAPLWLAAAAACSSSDSSVRVAIAPTIVFPHGVLGSVTKLTLQVYNAGDGVDCDATKGTTKGSAAAIATKDLASAGCPANAKFCGDVQVDTSSDARVFLAQGFATGNATPIASGCTKAVVSQATAQVQIKMLRFAPAATCGGKPSALPAVSCDAPGDTGDTVCDPNCISKEIFLSIGDSGTTSSSKAKFRPSLVWPAGAADAGRFVAFFGDKSPGSRTQVALRVLSDDLHPVTELGSGIESYSFFVPNDSSGKFPPFGEAGSQNNPSAAQLNDKYYVAFDNNASPPSVISLRSVNKTLNKSDQGPSAAIKISEGTAAMTQPSMAASGNGKLYVTWQAGGLILGRTVDPATFALGTQQTLGNGQNVVVAGRQDGWVVAYESGANVNMQLVDGAGAGKGESPVNDGSHSGQQVHPGVAALGDGRFAVSWIDSGAQSGAGVFVQRFGADGTAAKGDQAVRINTNAGAQASSAMGAGAAAGGFFVTAWVDQASGHVYARLLGGTSGFLFNNVSGQDDGFQVSQTDGRQRSNPAIAVGGASPFVAIAWQDDTTGLADPNFAGIWARRFPVPAQ
jgi:hypothetical protein